jgi:hypothetical protein
MAMQRTFPVDVGARAVRTPSRAETMAADKTSA